MFGALCMLCLATATPAPQPQVELLVLVAEGADVSSEDRLVLTTALTQALDGRHGLQAVSVVDLQSMANLEAYRQMADCADDTSCLAELGNALGAETLVGHRVTRLGNRLVWQASMLDVSSGTAVTRADVDADGIEGLVGRAPALAATLVPPSTWHTSLLYSGASLGAVGVIGAGIFGVWTLSIDRTLQTSPSVEAQKQAFDDAAYVPLLFVASVGVGVLGGIFALSTLVVE